MRRLPALLLPLLLLGCATPAAPGTSTAGVGPTELVTPGPSESPGPSEAAAPTPTVSFRACADEPPAPGSTHLAPPTTAELLPYSADLPGLSGPLRLVHALTLSLPTGSVLGGNGADAVWASSGYGFDPFPLTGGAVEADVTLVVWEPGDDRRVAWLELSFADAAVERWESVESLGVLTDGGDGGFWSSTAPNAFPEPVEDDEGNIDDSDLGPAFEAYLSASSSDGAPSPLCVVRATDGVEDGFVFGTGIGDGWYPTYAGYDAEGRVVSLLNDGGMPWETAGVTGTLPPDYEAPVFTDEP